MSGTIEFSEDFETGPDGTSLSTSNTGFDAVGGSGTHKFDSTLFATGSLSASISTTAISGHYSTLTHTLSTTQNTVFVRAAIYFPTVRSTASFLSFSTTGTSAYLQISTTDSKLRLIDNATTVATTAAAISTGQWFYVEFTVNSSAGTMSARYYGGLSGSPVETINGSYSGGTVNSVILGNPSPATFGFSADTFADAFDDWVGIPGGSSGLTPVATYYDDSAGKDTSTLTVTLTPSVGEILTVKTAMDSGGITAGVPSDTQGLTWTLAISYNSGTSAAAVFIWTSSPVTSAVSTTVSSGSLSSGRYHSMLVEEWPAGCSVGTATASQNGSGSAPSTSITTTGTNSAVSWIDGDYAAGATGSQVYLSSATEEQANKIGTGITYYDAYQAAAAPGAQTVGMSAPNQTWAIVAVEILAPSVPGISVAWLVS